MTQTQTQSPARPRKLIAASLVLLVIAGGLAWWGRSRPRFVHNLMAGHLNGCSLAQAIEADNTLTTQLATAKRFVMTSKLLATDPRGYEQWQTPKGTYWIPKGSSNAVMYDLAEQDRHIYSINGDGIHSGDVVLDCGANVGVYTREALDHGARLVIAIEPAPENIEVLRMTYAKEIAEGRVIVYPKGVWDKDDTLTLQVDPNNSARDSVVANLGAGMQSIKVPLTTIDKMVEELKLPRVDFIKMDIEGAEPRAVNGAAQTIARFRPRMALCLYHQPTDPATVPVNVAKAVPNYQLTVKCICSDEKIMPEVGHFR